MGNCCGTLKIQDESNNRRYARLINRESFSNIAILMDDAIESSKIIEYIHNDIQKKEIMEYNYNLILQIDQNLKFQESEENEAILSRMDFLQIISKRLLPKLQELFHNTEGLDITIMISRNRISHTLYSGEDFDKKTNTTIHQLSLSQSNSNEKHSTAKNNPGVPKIHKKKHNKDQVILYLKILKYRLQHQYDMDIIYQSEIPTYYRSDECVICYERRANVLFLGCMHLQICDICQTNEKDPNYDHILKCRSNCPICMIWCGHKNFDWIILKPHELKNKYKGI